MRTSIPHPKTDIIGENISVLQSRFGETSQNLKWFNP